MKIIYAVCTIFCLLLFNSCKSNSNPTDSGGIGGIGGGGGGSVTFTITQAAGSQGGIVLYGAPSVAVTVTNVNYSVANSTTKGDIQGDGTTVFPANQPVSISEFNAQAGLKYTLIFTGKLGSATGTAYTATSNYTIQ